jgi:hypothetical protein
MRTASALLPLLLAGTTADFTADEVTSLPGWDGAPPTKHYSGYVDVGNKRTLHYYLQMSEHEPATDPTVLWLNGGPGASSLLGAFTELGQLVFNRDSMRGVAGGGAPKLARNRDAWTQRANVLYLESPAGVGYSYCAYANCTSDDTQAAADAYAFLAAFFERFPQLAVNPFYMTGESYAGVYLPMLAANVLEAQAAAHGKGNAASPVPAIAGIAIGNGCWGTAVGTCGFGLSQKLILSEFYRGKGLMSKEQYAAVTGACGAPFREGGGEQQQQQQQQQQQSDDDGFGDDDRISADCVAAVRAGFDAVGQHNLYNVDDMCGTDFSANELLGRLRTAGSMHLPLGSSGGGGAAVSASGDAAEPALGSVQRWCGASNAMSAWLARNDTAAALNVRLPWGNGLHYIGGPGTPTGVARDLRPLYKTLAQTLPLMIYSGESDGCVPYVGTEEWTAGLGFPKLGAWHPWYGSAGAGGPHVAAGYAVHYGAPAKRFSFVTIKGAGHEGGCAACARLLLRARRGCARTACWYGSLSSRDTLPPPPHPPCSPRVPPPLPFASARVQARRRVRHARRVHPGQAALRNGRGKRTSTTL